MEGACIMPIRISTVAICLCVGLSASLAFAQARTATTGGTQAATGATTGTGNTGSTGANSGLSGLTGNAGGGGGGAGTGMSTGNQPSFNFNAGSIGAQVGQNAFAGQGNNGFVGARTTGQNTRATLMPQFNQMNTGNNDPNSGNTGGSVRTKRVRPQQRIAFTYPKANLAKSQLDLTQRFKAQSSVAGTTTTISDEGVATLNGTVKDDDSRKLAEAITRQEPGVRSVVNQLKVETATP